jgi:putative phosphoribosyl transferase
MFDDAAAAGRALVAALAPRRPDKPLVVAILHSGAPVARVVADGLLAPLDAALVARVTLPGSDTPIGAIDDAGQACITTTGCDGVEPYLVEHARLAAEDRFQPLRAACLRHDWRERTVLLVDDGAMTGAAMRLAIRQARRRGAAQVWVALPVAPRAVADSLAAAADQTVVLSQPESLGSVSEAYTLRTSVSDDEVLRLLGVPAGTPRASP